MGAVLGQRGELGGSGQTRGFWSGVGCPEMPGEDGRNRACSLSAPSLCLPCARGSLGRRWCSIWLSSLPEHDGRGVPAVCLGYSSLRHGVLWFPCRKCTPALAFRLGPSKSRRGPRRSTFSYFVFAGVALDSAVH